MLRSLALAAGSWWTPCDTKHTEFMQNSNEGLAFRVGP